MISGIVFFLLVISSPQIIAMIKGFLPEKKNELIMKEVTWLNHLPSIQRSRLRHLPGSKTPPIKDQISLYLRWS
jgi:hypothetical protein